jgi:hypothetical protein
MIFCLPVRVVKPRRQAREKIKGGAPGGAARVNKSIANFKLQISDLRFAIHHSAFPIPHFT